MCNSELMAYFVNSLLVTKIRYLYLFAWRYPCTWHGEAPEHTPTWSPIEVQETVVTECASGRRLTGCDHSWTGIFALVLALSSAQLPLLGWGWVRFKEWGGRKRVKPPSYSHTAEKHHLPWRQQQTGLPAKSSHLKSRSAPPARRDQEIHSTRCLASLPNKILFFA